MGNTLAIRRANGDQECNILLLFRPSFICPSNGLQPLLVLNTGSPLRSPESKSAMTVTKIRAARGRKLEMLATKFLILSILSCKPDCYRTGSSILIYR